MLTQKRRRDTRLAFESAGVSQAELQVMEGSIDTNRDAMEYVSKVVNAQVRLADASGAQRDVAVEGDRAARLAFLSLLGVTSQRTLFMAIFRQPGSSDRIQSIFGSPPYPWLAKEDAVLLNAAGIASRRVNMSSDALSGVEASVLNYNNFGLEHYVDQSGRQYRVTPLGQTRLGDPLFIAHAVTALSQFDTTCRIPKKVVRRGAGGRPTYEREKQRFPRIGETLQLTQSPLLGTIRLLSNSKQFAATVTKVVPRSSDAATALVQLRRVS